MGAHIFAEGAKIVHDALHLYRTLEHTRRRHGLRLYRSEPCDAEFVLFIAIAPLPLLLRHRVFAGGQRKTVNVRDQILGWQIDHTLASADEVVGGLAHLA